MFYTEEKLCRAQETVRLFCRPQMDEVRKVKVVDGNECLLNKFKEILKQVLRENGQKGKPKCFNCGGVSFQKKL